jgi:hypothetical protein
MGVGWDARSQARALRRDDARRIEFLGLARGRASPLRPGSAGQKFPGLVAEHSAFAQFPYCFARAEGNTIVPKFPQHCLSFGYCRPLGLVSDFPPLSISIEKGASMNQPLALPTRRGRGNPDWGKPLWSPTTQTEFEMQAEKLGLSKGDYADSSDLRRWCARNLNRCYIPEWLLNEWGMDVDAIFSGTT